MRCFAILAYTACLLCSFIVPVHGDTGLSDFCTEEFPSLLGLGLSEDGTVVSVTQHQARVRSDQGRSNRFRSGESGDKQCRDCPRH